MGETSSSLGGDSVSAKPKRTKLEDFPCCFVTDPRCHCHEACDGFDDCEIGEVYREYLALLKCARLLRVFEKRWGAKFSFLVCIGIGKNELLMRHEQQWEQLRTRIRDALRAAGLETE